MASFINMTSNKVFVFIAILSCLVLHSSASDLSNTELDWSGDMPVSEQDVSQRQKRSKIAVYVGSRIIGSVGEETINRLGLVNLDQNPGSKCNMIVRGIIAGSGCLTGLVLGASVGTVVPGPGNILGAVVGVVVGCGLAGAAADIRHMC